MGPCVRTAFSHSGYVFLLSWEGGVLPLVTAFCKNHQVNEVQLKGLHRAIGGRKEFGELSVYLSLD